MNRLKVRQDLERFFLEDIASCDLTSQLLFSQDQFGHGKIFMKEKGVFSGESVIVEGFRLISDTIHVDMMVHDGQQLNKGDTIAILSGPVGKILEGERVVLNLIQRMSGIATQTFRAKNLLEGDSIKVCDTRKTTPGLRMFEKYAVRCGGGVNHRLTLDGGVMIKDNHIAMYGNINVAVAQVRKALGPMTKIEVETETVDQVREAVEAKADIIMFDNRTPEEIRELVELVPGHIVTEASGGITLNNLASYKNCGVDFISLGALTHSVKSLDISLELEVE
ncbi:carboxylating nicotinate-nucleotide diphosphorylase [Pseudalkalibacillus berkeleyi]|uniref:nicotinate-nucleotide diphosphorylase (carboxylating) n=1 Tax=Pseudalkalibacillus berkeleyi TaxID=1069813 RepID=A0ABS9GXG2_9BACL|nr:carboxylating nicotinate-nucleotide diphosphorylase [Pseudalkalibacillus berkeleyi]MCF6136380.1 carboxylating nicotinate-nucleotide diphosphorylase [Pseudalkalibacillus berkeleyi]